VVATVTGALRPLQGVFKVLVVLTALLALLLTTSFAAPRARAATSAPQLKAVLIVGPSGLTSTNKPDADAVAAKAAAYGMDVRKVYTPHATWQAVLDNIQGANLVLYWGHGNGWPSPYGPFQEKTKDGFGLNATDGSNTVDYRGGNAIRNSVTLAPNAIVGLSHACYTSGNGEPGMAIPGADVARQRADNYAAAFLYAGAGAVFALQTGSFTYIVDLLFSGNKTMDQVFSTKGAGAAAGLAYYGFVGTNDQYFDSQRMPGNKNHLDPDAPNGWRRSLTGDMNLTTDDWMSGTGGGGGGGGTSGGPTVGAPSASFVTGTSGKSNVTLKLNWDASSTPNVTYELQVSQDSGAWMPVTLGSPTDLTVNYSAAPAHYYRFRLRATDSSSNVGDWATTANRKLGRVQETAASLTYTGTWSSKVYLSGASKSYVKKASTAGNNVSWTFTGRYVGLVSSVGANRGMAEVWVDGSKVGTVDLYAATTKAGKMVWSMDVPAGSHTVQVRALGTKNGSATGSRVDFDALVTWN
jgi:hypothetical protein